MINFTYRFLYTTVLISLISCNSPHKNIEFDSESWKQDIHGCEGKRAALAQRIKTLKPQLTGADELTILNLLGKPDKEQISSRGTKTFYYYLNGGRDKCGTKEIPWLLSLDFGALNNVRIITFQRF